MLRHKYFKNSLVESSLEYVRFIWPLYTNSTDFYVFGESFVAILRLASFWKYFFQFFYGVKRASVEVSCLYFVYQVLSELRWNSAFIAGFYFNYRYVYFCSWRCLSFREVNFPT